MAAAHIDDDALEAYSLGRLVDTEAAPIEEHLLVCAECRDRLTGWDDYIAAMRKAMRALSTASGTGGTY
ncbi:MAG: hypothetical protein M1541_01640 [Acidobacteria bacterium]|nr:hypothetical protein [Acidobacteriota bacterium]